jgi:predicted Zn-dependent protease
MKKRLCLFLALAFMTLSVLACETMESATKLATAVGVGTGVITQGQGDAILKSTTAIARSAEDFTPEQEYYIGRSVGAMVLDKYPAYGNDGANRYLNTLGQALAEASDKPEIFGGHHFLILDSDDINAFATPSGLIFVTRGLIRCCGTEDALAAVLAHELGHIQLRHGMQAIEKARVTEAITVVAQEGAKTLGSRQVAQLTQTFSGAISDITNTLINKGYSRSFEYQADQAAIDLLRRVGYNPAGLTDMLTLMERNLKPGGFDFAKTHPAPRDRIGEIVNRYGTFTGTGKLPARQARFQKALGGL